MPLLSEEEFSVRYPGRSDDGLRPDGLLPLDPILDENSRFLEGIFGGTGVFPGFVALKENQIELRKRCGLHAVDDSIDSKLQAFVDVGLQEVDPILFEPGFPGSPLLLPTAFVDTEKIGER